MSAGWWFAIGFVVWNLTWTGFYLWGYYTGHREGYIDGRLSLTSELWAASKHRPSRVVPADRNQT